MRRIPRPPSNIPPQMDPIDAEDVSLIMHRLLDKKHLNNPTVMRFLSEYLMCRDVAQAAYKANISKREGQLIIRRKDVQKALVQITNTAILKDNLDPEEIVEKVKNIAFVDPVDTVNPDGTAIENLHDIPHEVRRAIKKFEIKNLYETDPNGMKVVVGKLVKVEFWDRLKATEMLGREVGKFKETTVHEVGPTQEMKKLLLEAKDRSERRAEEIRELDQREVKDVTPKTDDT